MLSTAKGAKFAIYDCLVLFDMCFDDDVAVVHLVCPCRTKWLTVKSSPATQNFSELGVVVGMRAYL